LALLNDIAGKLQLVKKLLDKLENLLRANATNDDSHNTLGAIDMFLDTSLQEFTERDEVASRPSEQGFNSEQEDVTGATGLQSFQFSSLNASLAESTKRVETLSNLLERTSLPYITSTEQIQLAMIVDCISEVEILYAKLTFYSLSNIIDHWILMRRDISCSSDKAYY
jgi:RAVE protein 1 C terminal